jgi:hypothetical protein
MGSLCIKSFVASVLAVALGSLGAAAQDRNVTTERQVAAQPVLPAPESDSAIIVNFGSASRIYFKHPIKAIRIDDQFALKAVPQSEHIVEFTGLAPGETKVVLERKDGKGDVVALVNVVSDPHPVRIFKSQSVNRVSGELRQDQAGSGHETQYCNQVRCEYVAPRP